MCIDYKLIGSRIKAERKKRELTQEALAERLDVTTGYVSQVERGITKISLDLLGEISTVLECNVADLITESVTSSENYLYDDITSKLIRLGGRQRKILLDFIELLLEA